MLSKQALDALKARTMAKSLGLEPEAGSAWKWALRNMRNMHTGYPLQGEELGQAKLRIGKLPEGLRNLINDTSQREGKEKEIGMTFYTTGRPHKADLFVGDGGSVEFDIRNDEKDSLIRHIHTHPFTGGGIGASSVDIAELGDELKGMSSKEQENFKEGIRSWLFQNARERYRTRRIKPTLVSPSGYINRIPYAKEADHSPTEYRNEQNADFGTFLHTGNRHPDAKFSIYNPEFGFESTHKPREVDLRSVYWSGNPEALENAVPVIGLKTPSESVNEDMSQLFPTSSSKRLVTAGYMLDQANEAPLGLAKLAEEFIGTQRSQRMV